MTSNQGLSLSSSSGRRTSQHFLRTNDTRGLGSPSSIPSSPTSIHSSSSAIFERDIEPILISPMATSPPHSSSLFSSAPPLPLASPSSGVGGHHHVTSVSSTHSTSHSPHKPLDPHRIPRAKATEQLEQSVPSVLDSAAAILANLPPSSPGVGGASGELQGDALDTVQVVAPGHASAGFDNSLFVLGAGGVAGNTTSFASGGGSLFAESESESWWDEGAEWACAGVIEYPVSHQHYHYDYYFATGWVTSWFTTPPLTPTHQPKHDKPPTLTHTRSNQTPLLHVILGPLSVHTYVHAHPSLSNHQRVVLRASPAYTKCIGS
ncbi:hypothetical protein MD484_g7481, partial [Candolleomyces efflorescens]